MFGDTDGTPVTVGKIKKQVDKSQGVYFLASLVPCRKNSDSGTFWDSQSLGTSVPGGLFSKNRLFTAQGDAWGLGTCLQSTWAATAVAGLGTGPLFPPAPEPWFQYPHAQTSYTDTPNIAPQSRKPSSNPGVHLGRGGSVFPAPEPGPTRLGGNATICICMDGPVGILLSEMSEKYHLFSCWR